MSDVSKTNAEVIGKNRKLWLDTRGVPVITTTKNGESNAIRWGWTEAKAVDVDALEAATRVPVQGEPSDEREARVKRIILESLVFTNENSDPWAQLLTENILAALDGAPEPEWEVQYGRMYFDEAGDPHIRETSDVTSPDGHRADGSPYWNYRPMRRRKAGPWLPVEGESKP